MKFNIESVTLAETRVMSSQAHESTAISPCYFLTQGYIQVRRARHSYPHSRLVQHRIANTTTEQYA